MVLSTPSRFGLAVRAALTLLSAAPAAAGGPIGVPSPANSSLPGCFATSPNAALLSLVVVRDLNSLPLSNSHVVLDYSQCATFRPCPQTGTPADDYVVDLTTQTIHMITNAQGEAPFFLRAGGGCSADNLRVIADGVILGFRRSASTDQNADHSVDDADAAVLHTKVGTTDLTGDLNCDFMVNEDDEFVLAAALGTNCLIPVPVRPSTWGRVKTIYR